MCQSKNWEMCEVTYFSFSNGETRESYHVLLRNSEIWKISHISFSNREVVHVLFNKRKMRGSNKYFFSKSGKCREVMAFYPTVGNWRKVAHVLFSSEKLWDRYSLLLGNRYKYVRPTIDSKIKVLI
jgi:hypothetical protein